MTERAAAWQSLRRRLASGEPVTLCNRKTEQTAPGLTYAPAAAPIRCNVTGIDLARGPDRGEIIQIRGEAMPGEEGSDAG